MAWRVCRLHGGADERARLPRRVRPYPLRLHARRQLHRPEQRFGQRHSRRKDRRYLCRRDLRLLPRRYPDRLRSKRHVPSRVKHPALRGRGDPCPYVHGSRTCLHHTELTRTTNHPIAKRQARSGLPLVCLLPFKSCSDAPSAASIPPLGRIKMLLTFSSAHSFNLGCILIYASAPAAFCCGRSAGAGSRARRAGSRAGPLARTPPPRGHRRPFRRPLRSRPSPSYIPEIFRV